MIDDVYSYDGLHPQKKKGHHRRVIQSELKLISDKRNHSRFSVCIQLAVNRKSDPHWLFASIVLWMIMTIDRYKCDLTSRQGVFL